MHLIMFFVTFYGEIYDDKLTTLSHIMRFLRILAIGYITYILILMFTMRSAFDTIFKLKFFEGYYHIGVTPKCFENENNTRKTLGNAN